MPPLFSCQSLNKSFFSRTLFRNISLTLEEGERIGLIGPNGSGKSTLMKIIVGTEKPDSGNVAPRRGIRMEYVPQEDAFPAGSTVAEVLDKALESTSLEAYERDMEVSIVLAKFGFQEPHQVVDTLSGGWRKRLAIARALIREPELLLLDEPTNHLDIEGILWLERLLASANYAVLVISHDRYFLESVATRLVELSSTYPDGYLSVDGTYSDFLIRKEEFLAAQNQLQHTLNKQAVREVAWLRHGAPARSTKSKYRIEAAGKLLDELASVTFRNNQGKAVDIDFSATQRKANELLVAKAVSKAMGGRTLFRDLNISLSHKDRLGLIGSNGSGKTTLLRLLTDELQPDSGVIRRADNLRVVRFDQNRATLDKKVSLRQALSPNSDFVPFQGGSIHVAGWASRFLFRSEQLEQPVGALSGGEQARVLIARLMLEPADVLILDEPTNDLDIPSLEMLEESLLEFPGAVILVTHDRYLLDRVSTQLLALEEDGKTAYYAEYAQWEEKNEPVKEVFSRSNPYAKPMPKPSEKSLRRLSTAEKRELEGMEETILLAEGDVKALQARLQDPEIVSDHLRMEMIWKAIQGAEERVAALYVRWEELEARK